MPDTAELREHFGQPSGQAAGCGFPVAHLMTLFDARRGYLLRASSRPLETHDMSQAAAMHRELRSGDVLVGDRAFASFAHLVLCLWQGIHILEATERFSDRNAFVKALEKFGFAMVGVEDKWKFTHIRAIKTERRPSENGELRF